MNLTLTVIHSRESGKGRCILPLMQGLAPFKFSLDQESSPLPFLFEQMLTNPPVTVFNWQFTVCCAAEISREQNLVWHGPGLQRTWWHAMRWPCVHREILHNQAWLLQTPIGERSKGKNKTGGGGVVVEDNTDKTKKQWQSYEKAWRDSKTVWWRKCNIGQWTALHLIRY